MQTYRRIQFWPLDPRPEEVDIEDIAHALSMQCRYGGHVRHFYSVAEHSILVSRMVPREDALWGLLHDASEAYLSDVIRPVKRFLTNYKAIENRLMAVICERFGLPPEQPESVTWADNAILADERERVMGGEIAPWRLEHGPTGVDIRCHAPVTARADFLHRFHQLTVG